MVRLIRSILILIVLVALLISPAQAKPDAPAAPGDLDLTFAGFGASGLITITETKGVYSMALQPDGKIVIAGFKLSNESDIVVMRYQSNGAPDTTFAGDGSVTISYPGFDIRAYAVAVQSDGKIVVTGEIFGDPSSFLVARLTKAGALDPSFGDGGFVITDFGSNVDVADAVVIQPDGKIVVAGYAMIGGDEDFAVARYNLDGKLDNTFSGDGKVTIGFGGTDEAWDIALQDDGKLVLAGPSVQGFFLDHYFAIARLNVNGSLDNSFDGDGKLTTALGDAATASAVAIQTDGKIVAAGGNAVARYLPNGSLDNSFDGDGKYSVASSDYLSDVAAQPDGKIVLLGGHQSLDNTFKFSFWRLNPNASRDTTFDGDGDAFLDLGGDGGGTDLALQPDGRLLALGHVGNSRVLLRLWPDATFDTGGQQTLGFADPLFGLGSDEEARGVAIQPDGKIVVAGEVDNPANTEQDLALVRFLPGGQLDTLFGDGGRVRFGIGQYDAATAIAIQPDGKIVVAGFSDPFGAVESNFLAARFNPDGTKDDTFNFLGFNIADFLGSTDRGFALALTPDGKVVVAGSVWNGSRNVIGVARFTSDGLLDPTFDGDGKVITQWVPQFNSVAAVVVQPDGKIVVGGQAGEDFGLLRLATNGALDGSFGSQGVTITNMGGVDYLHALALAPDGRFYAAGGAAVNNIGYIALAQYTPNGVLENSPDGWPGGKVLVNPGGSVAAYAMDLRSDGQVVAAGCGNMGIIWAQLPITGSNLSPLIGTTNFAGSGECALGVKFTGTHKIVTVGRQIFNDDFNMSLARFETTVDATVPVVYPLFLPLVMRQP